MTKTDGLPRRVYPKHGRYWFVTPAGKWQPLTRIDKGLPAMLRALATLTEQAVSSDLMPAVATRWADERAREAGWATGTKRDIERVLAHLSKRMALLRPDQITTKLAAEYLRTWATKARTHNLHRTVLRQILAFAAVEGLREGHNPADDIPPKTMPKRLRIVTDAEVAALKAGALQQSRNGEALVQMIDLALLTGQRIGDLIKLRWQDVTDDGLVFVQGKGKGRVRLLVEWSPALRAAIDACAEGRHCIGHVLKTQSGGSYTYGGIRSAWVRACTRAGLEDLHIHDLRGRAGVDALEAAGQDVRAAQALLGHSAEGMTRHYTDGKYAKRVKPAG